MIRHAFAEETLRPGPAVFLKCVAGGNPTPEISWELDGKKITNNERYQVGQYVTVNGDVVSYLNITSIHTNDGGLYKCFASSKVGTAEHSAKINVYGLPYIRPMEKKAIVAGETLVVTCPVAGYPIKSIVWERGKYHLYLIDSVRLEKQNHYKKCIIQHKYNTNTHIFHCNRQSCAANQPKAKGLPQRNAHH